MSSVQFYAYTSPTLPPPETTPFLQAFKESDNSITIRVRGSDGAHASISLSVEEALRFSIRLGAAKFAHEVIAAREKRGTIKFTINGVEHELPIGTSVSYTWLVQRAGLTDNPSMSVSFGDRSRSGIAPHQNSPLIALDDGASVTVVHT